MEETVTIALEDASLEARLARPSSPTAGVAVCHPHPLYGGDMDNPVVRRAAEACRGAGLVTLRFNFRGVGKSTGVRAGGQAEQADVRGALALLGTLLGPSLPLGLVGYSFGAWVASQVAVADGHVSGLAAIAPPVAFYDFALLSDWHGTLLLVAGSHDPYCPREQLEGLAADLASGRLVVIEGSDHFFLGKLYPLGEAVAAWARSWSAAGTGKTGGRGGPS